MDIFDYAIRMEKDGEQLYRELADDSNDPGLKRIFSMLADDEVKHAAVLAALKQDQRAEMVQTNILGDARNIFAQARENKLSIFTSSDHIELYKKAQELEKTSEAFYLEKARETDRAPQAGILEKIADEEKRHYFLLQNIIDLVSRPKQWLEDAEFNHLEDY